MLFYSEAMLPDVPAAQRLRAAVTSRGSDFTQAGRCGSSSPDLRVPC